MVEQAEGRGRSVETTTQPPVAWLDEPGCCFVTLTIDGRLAGCIGSLEPRRTLLHDVRDNAVAAATRDPRFAPLRPEELTRTRFEVSVLSAPEPIACADERQALALLRPGVDGVIWEGAGRRATFLPQVWDKVSGPGEFLDALRAKAGLPPGYWSEEVRLSRYTVTAYHEQDELEGGG